MMNRVINLGAFAILSILWLVFGGALVLNRDVLDSIWQMFTGWPILVQVVLGLLVLPVTAGLWVWETSWPVLLRLIVVAGLAWATVYTFFPKRSIMRG